jgi:hypothetical protein
MKFDSTQAMNLVTLAVQFGNDFVDDFAGAFSAHGEGVYCITTGSRGEVEGVEFATADAIFAHTDHTDYEGQLEQARDNDEEDEEDFEEDFEYDTEFTSCSWDENTFVCGVDEEHAEVYVYFAPSLLEVASAA